MDAVREEFKDGVCTIWLNRPEKKNAMDSELLPALHRALLHAQEKKSAVVIIRGEGKAFCAGGDIVEFRQSTDTGSRIDSMADSLHKSIMLIRNMEAIVVAVIEGVAVGAGLGLSLACDLSVAGKKAIMNMGYRKIGLTPDGGGSILLPRIVGAKRFNEMYLFSGNVTMDEAKDLGLVNFVWEEAEIDGNLEKMIRDLKALPLETIGPFKDLVNRSLFSGLDVHLDKERFYVAELGGKVQFKERLDAFFSKK
jgi:2-(1,2-epoxy-1,2-dihydrophenyl)acetyl-CoA isomerase